MWWFCTLSVLNAIHATAYLPTVAQLSSRHKTYELLISHACDLSDAPLCTGQILVIPYYGQQVFEIE